MMTGRNHNDRSQRAPSREHSASYYPTMARQPGPRITPSWERPLLMNPDLAGGEGPSPNSPTSATKQRTHVLTIALEDYFHVTPLQTVITQDRWYRFEMRLEASTRRTLDLLDECGARATFFVLGWVADAAPELVREVTARGHEVASKGYYHRDLRLGREAFEEDAVRSREALERATGRRVRGYRLAQQWLRPADFWVLEVLARAGYEYDSSLRMVFRTYAREPWRQFPHRTTIDGRTFLEVPLSSMRVLGLDVPIAGGNYFRQFPHSLVKRAVAHWDRSYDDPFVMYFHTWELDPDQPRINGVPLRQQIRQYRNLRKMPAIVRYYLERYRFTSVAQYFELGTEDPEGLVGAAAPSSAHASAVGANATQEQPERTAVSVVVPCFNEQETLPYLANTLRSVVGKLGDRYDFRFVFVDDCSTDRTWQTLHTVFGGDPRNALVQHERNRGVAAAIQTGLRVATADVVCSMDCDCTYDPHELGRMIPLLTDDVDVVTASPYHPLGTVKNVPRWRLFLSKGLSRLYRVVLRQKLYTYTSCFRVYRRQSALGITVERGGFFGVAEMLGRLDLAGRRIVEYPATLEARMIGRSKMKVLRTITGHLSLLAHLAQVRLWRKGRPVDAPLARTAHE
jgi:polysaccharide deacetylase family protein (PEP-CTERM system associated)